MGRLIGDLVTLTMGMFAFGIFISLFREETSRRRRNLLTVGFILIFLVLAVIVWQGRQARSAAREAARAEASRDRLGTPAATPSIASPPPASLPPSASPGAAPAR